MFWQRNSSLSTYQIVRPIIAFLIASAVVAGGMAIVGRGVASLLMVGMMVLTGLLLAIEVHRSVSHLKNQSMNLQQASDQAEQHYIDVLQRIIRYVEARDKHTSGRSERIGKLAERMSRRMQLPAEQCKLMSMAGQLHDIGLLVVPESTLNKRGSLGVGEFRSVQKHSEVSYELLRPLESLAPVLSAIRWHHERMNGTGYPDGLADERLPMEARILAVADAYDAMTHDRPHRGAMTQLEAMDELRRCTPAGYDRQCVEALAGVLNMPELGRAVNAASNPSLDTPREPL